MHLSKVAYSGDKMLENFKHQWLHVARLQSSAVSDSCLAQMLHEKLRASNVMAADISAYRRDVVEVKGWDYEALLRLMDRHIRLQREDINSRNLNDSISRATGSPSKSNHAASAHTGKARSLKEREKEKVKEKETDLVDSSIPRKGAETVTRAHSRTTLRHDHKA